MKAFLRRNRAVLALGGALLAALTVLAIATGLGGRGELDPDGYDPTGAHALAVLLHQQGVDVVRTTDVPATVAAAGSDTTVFVPLPLLLSPEEVQALAPLPGALVVAGAPKEELQALGVAVGSVDPSGAKEQQPGCDLPVARNAGKALTGGARYTGGSGTTSCYGGSLLAVPGRAALVLGAADGLTNQHLGQQGNAALGIGLLGAHRTVVWLVPSPTRAAFGVRPLTSPEDTLPAWVHAVRRQLFVTLLVLALWRGRRLGRVVLERLPVVVRASETVEGHGRLYQAARSREAAATALRAAARRSVARLVHDGAASPEVLVDLVAARSGREATRVQALLYGPTPADDAALVQLARDLDTLTQDALTREGAGT